MRRAKESLLVIAVGTVLLCAPPAPAHAAPQGATAPPRAAPAPNNARKKAGDAKTGRGAAAAPNTTNENRNAPAAPPPAGAATGAGAPAEDGHDARAGVTPTPTAIPTAQATPEDKVGKPEARPAPESLAATARRLLNDWGLTAGLVATALGLVALAVYTFKLRSRLNRDLQNVTDQLRAVNGHLRGAGEVALPGQPVPRSHAPRADGASDKAADDEATPEEAVEGEQEQAADIQLSHLADAVKKLATRVDEIETRLPGGSGTKAAQPAEEEEAEESYDVGDVPRIRPPQNMTVDKMVEWANGAGLRLERVKATFGLFGNFSRSDDGDNWLAVSDGDSYLFPRVNRFESGSHFSSNYFDYYYCDNPSAGKVLVERPAKVSSDPQGGWKLEEKGKLSVIAS